MMTCTSREAKVLSAHGTVFLPPTFLKESVQETTVLIVFAKLQPSHRYTPQTLWGAGSLLLTWYVCANNSEIRMLCLVIFTGEKVKDGGERKEGGRGGGCLKNAACVAVATRKTTRGSPWPGPPPPHSLLLLSIHFTICCHFGSFIF